MRRSVLTHAHVAVLLESANIIHQSSSSPSWTILGTQRVEGISSSVLRVLGHLHGVALVLDVQVVSDVREGDFITSPV